jgi:hypothetical protein
MNEKLKNWMGEAFPTAILVSIFFIINWIFVLKSQGLLKTEEEWYGFGAFLMNVIPITVGFVIVFHLIAFFVFYSVEKLLEKWNKK